MNNFVYTKKYAKIHDNGGIEIKEENFSFLKNEKKSNKIGCLIVNLSNKISLEFIIQTLRNNFSNSVCIGNPIFIGTNTKGNKVYKNFLELGSLYEGKDMVIGGWDSDTASISFLAYNAGFKTNDISWKLNSIKQKKIIPNRRKNYHYYEKNILEGMSNSEILRKIKTDIQFFKIENNLDSVIVINAEDNTEENKKLYTTEREIIGDVKTNEYIDPFYMYGLAALSLGCNYIAINSVKSLDCFYNLAKSNLCHYYSGIIKPNFNTIFDLVNISYYFSNIQISRENETAKKLKPLLVLLNYFYVYKASKEDLNTTCSIETLKNFFRISNSIPYNDYLDLNNQI